MKAINNQTNAEKSLGKLPVWRLADLYMSQNDKKLFIDLNNIKKETKKFEKKYFNKVKLLSAERLLEAIVKLEEIDIWMDKILSYAHLLVARMAIMKIKFLSKNANYYRLCILNYFFYP